MEALDDRVVLVTGSTKGIGHAIATAFTERGARVIVHGRDNESVERIRNEIGAYAGVTGDLGNIEGSREVLDQLARQSFPILR